ncbi:MAG: glycerophosphodiester phosphodiesterase [Spirochaetes bacterium]|nr:glycerophosphodiester phosphodiesterase [Spirochaetota bacterium]
MHTKKPLIFAHRGVSSQCPENTLSAFRKAIEVGADGIELDVHRSKDGHLLVCHDETVDRTTDGKGVIQEMTRKDLSKLDAGSWFGTAFKGERIPMLEEVLNILQPTTLLLNIELKTDYFFYPGIEEETYALIQKYGMEDRVILSSFNHYTVLRFRRIAPKVRTGILYSCHLFAPHTYASSLGVQALHPPMHLAQTEIIEAAHEAGLTVHGWFSRERFDVERAKNYLGSYVDILITNYPQEYLSLRDKG